MYLLTRYSFVSLSLILLTHLTLIIFKQKKVERCFFSVRHRQQHRRRRRRVRRLIVPWFF